MNLFKDFVLGSSNFQKDSWSAVGKNSSYTLEQIDGCTEKAKELKPILDWHRDYLKETLDKNLGNVGKVLDYGCGSGRYLKYLEEQTDLELYGIDFSETTLTNFTSKNVKRSPLMAADLSQKSLLVSKYQGFFDAIYSITVIQYITPSKIKTLFKNLSVMLKKNGLLVLLFPIPVGVLDIFKYYHYVRYPPHYLEKIIKRMGFEIIFSGETLTKKYIPWFHSDPKTNHGYWLVVRKTKHDGG